MGRKAKERKEPQTDHEKALAKADAVRMQRQVRVELLTDGLPYRREVYVSQVKMMLKRTAEDMLMIGKMLLAIKENEPHGEFTKVCEEELGIPERTARRFMYCAIQAEKFPRIATEFAKTAKLAGLYTVLEAPEEDLKQLETKGILAGCDIDELAKLSIKELREKIKKLESEQEKVVKAETKNLRVERDALIKEVARLKPFDPEEQGDNVFLEQFKVIEEMLREFDHAVRKLAFKHPKVQEDIVQQGKIEQVLAGMKKRIMAIDHEWAEFVAVEQ